jgi:hypothetical protein
MRTYFRQLKISDTEGWLAKTMEFTGQSEQEIKRALSAKRSAKKNSKPEKPATVQTTTTKLPVIDIIDTMTTPQEASDFVRSSPAISEQFLIFVTGARKRKRPPKQ